MMKLSVLDGLSQVSVIAMMSGWFETTKLLKDAVLFFIDLTFIMHTLEVCGHLSWVEANVTRKNKNPGCLWVYIFERGGDSTAVTLVGNKSYVATI